MPAVRLYCRELPAPPAHAVDVVVNDHLCFQLADGRLYYRRRAGHPYYEIPLSMLDPGGDLPAGEHDPRVPPEE